MYLGVPSVCFMQVTHFLSKYKINVLDPCAGIRLGESVMVCALLRCGHLLATIYATSIRHHIPSA